VIECDSWRERGEHVKPYVCSFHTIWSVRLKPNIYFVARDLDPRTAKDKVL